MAEQLSSLLSSHKPSQSGLHVHLHPLVLLTISDHITRHISRRRLGPIVGALLGRQHGREISLEFAFECDVIGGDGDVITLNDSWFRDRLQQYKDVHKVPPLDLVGWFTTAPTTGPEAPHVPIHQKILQDYNETAVLLAFHPSAISEGASTGGASTGGASTGGKLPLTLYESVYESVKAEGQNFGQDHGAMEIEGQDVSLDSQLEIRFRELPYSVETGEAEMIGVDFVARGGGNATAGDADARSSKAQASQHSSNPFSADRKTGKKRVDGVVDEAGALSPEDEELISLLNARANAVKMLHTRIEMLKAYLTNLPPSYLTTPTQPELSSDAPDPQHSKINHPILRSIQALLNRLPLLVPNQAAFEHDRLAVRSDVSLVDLLGQLSKSVQGTREVGRKFGIVEQSRATKRLPAVVLNEDFMLPSEKADRLTPW